jgi:hypothetical protein
MTDLVLDCCTLLNLYCGWGGLQKLQEFGPSFHFGQRVADEILFVRDFDDSGLLVDRKLSADELMIQYRFSILQLSSPQEEDLMVRLAARLDDGEAEGLAIASCRGLIFCSDDKPAAEAARAEGLDTVIISTPELLQMWAGSNIMRISALPEIVRRTSTLGRFCPHRSSPHRAWWKEQQAL